MTGSWREMLSNLPLRYRWWAAGAVLAGAIAMAAAAALLWHEHELALELTREILAGFEGWLQSAGKGWFFVAFVVGPLIFAPVSIFYLTAGVYGYEWAIPLTWCALALNVSLAYWVASRGVRPPIEWLIERRGYAVPAIREGEDWKVVVVVRVTPLLPFSIQSYLLGLARVRFGTYMWISLGIQAPIAAGMILVGDSLFRGRVGLAITGVCVMVIVFLMIKLLRDRYGTKL